MGLIHIYYGEGKGKTTAAVGLAVRAKGAGHNVLFQQYMKDGQSAELSQLEKLGIEVMSGQPDPATGFTWDLDDDQKAILRTYQDARLDQAFEWLHSHQTPGVLVLDEALASSFYELLNGERLLELMDLAKAQDIGPDLILTGRHPTEDMLKRADYLSEIRPVRHPFDKGIAARRGIEY